MHTSNWQQKSHITTSVHYQRLFKHINSHLTKT